MKKTKEERLWKFLSKYFKADEVRGSYDARKIYDYITKYYK